ncbi:hypothetical protein VNO80_05763 [Phaseolus coccineus]|uniref:Uncharacterized protein n=1 Tax=Phaseolus coccineus TaxID=3886 RepID=A0AAN9NGL3_PHACN
MIHSVDVTVRGTRGPFYYLCPIGEVSLLSSREDCVTHSDISEAVFIVRSLIEHTTIVALISYPIRQEGMAMAKAKAKAKAKAYHARDGKYHCSSL